MDTPRIDQPEPAALDVECPWCGASATIEIVRSGREDVATLTCHACSVGVELAPDPVATPFARAA
jgi:hypothetical protein